jgi:hypothetical protein
MPSAVVAGKHNDGAGGNRDGDGGEQRPPQGKTTSGHYLENNVILPQSVYGTTTQLASVMAKITYDARIVSNLQTMNTVKSGDSAKIGVQLGPEMRSTEEKKAAIILLCCRQDPNIQSVIAPHARFL